MAIQIECKVGMTVGVMKWGNYGSVHSQGEYEVTKVNKMVVELTRKSDGYKRVWSAKTGVEKDSYSTQYRTADIVSVEFLHRHLAEEAKRKELNQKWSALEGAAAKQDLAAAEALLAELKALTGAEAK